MSNSTAGKSIVGNGKASHKEGKEIVTTPTAKTQSRSNSNGCIKKNLFDNPKTTSQSNAASEIFRSDVLSYFLRTPTNFEKENNLNLQNQRYLDTNKQLKQREPNMNLKYKTATSALLNEDELTLNGVREHRIPNLKGADENNMNMGKLLKSLLHPGSLNIEAGSRKNSKSKKSNFSSPDTRPIVATRSHGNIKQQQQQQQLQNAQESFNKTKTHSILSKAISQIRQKQHEVQSAAYLEGLNSFISNYPVESVTTPKTPSHDQGQYSYKGLGKTKASLQASQLNLNKNNYLVSGPEILRHKGSLVEINKKTLYQMIQNKTLSPKCFSKINMNNQNYSGFNKSNDNIANGSDQASREVSPDETNSRTFLSRLLSQVNKLKQSRKSPNNTLHRRRNTKKSNGSLHNITEKHPLFLEDISEIKPEENSHLTNSAIKIKKRMKSSGNAQAPKPKKVEENVYQNVGLEMSAQRKRRSLPEGFEEDLILKGPEINVYNAFERGGNEKRRSSSSGEEKHQKEVQRKEESPLDKFLKNFNVGHTGQQENLANVKEGLKKLLQAPNEKSLKTAETKGLISKSGENKHNTRYEAAELEPIRISTKSQSQHSEPDLSRFDVNIEVLQQNEIVFSGIIKEFKKKDQVIDHCKRFFQILGGPKRKEMSIQILKDPNSCKSLLVQTLLERVFVTIALTMSLDETLKTKYEASFQKASQYVFQNLILLIEIILDDYSSNLPEKTLENLRTTLIFNKTRDTSKVDKYLIIAKNNQIITRQMTAIAITFHFPISVISVKNNSSPPFPKLMEILTSAENCSLKEGTKMLMESFTSVLAEISKEETRADIDQTFIEEEINFEELQIAASRGPFLPDIKKGFEYTLVIDLDETLVHYEELQKPNSGQFLVRPFAEEFLSQMADFFELVIFTASTPEYADYILDRIDPNSKISHRLYRHHTTLKGLTYIKDLSKLGRDLSKVIIVDNLPENFQLQSENGIHIQSWYGDPTDKYLFNLAPLLKTLVKKKISDVRIALRKLRLVSEN